MIFKKADWINTTDVYEVNIRQYSQEGTFKAFEKELPRLKDMGVSTLWFMPITPIAQKLKKGTMGSPYACSDYTSINPEFGNLDDFKSIVTKDVKFVFPSEKTFVQRANMILRNTKPTYLEVSCI